MTQTFQIIADRVAAAGGRIDAADVAACRRLAYPGGRIDRNGAEGLFLVERARRVHAADWSALFVEALTEFTVTALPPSGYLSDMNADWLESKIAERKEPAMDADVALVANVVEEAAEVPAKFSAFALRLVKDAVVYGDGVDERGREHGAGRITAADVDLLRRILWGAGSEGLLAVSREEAEALFAIADATTGADNVPEFDDLFARAVGNYLMGATGRSVPQREVALRRETEGPYKASVLKVLSGMLDVANLAPRHIRDTLANVRNLSEDVDAEQSRQSLEREAMETASSAITANEAQWLADRIARNGLTSGPERALLEFVHREATTIDPALDKLMATVA